MEQLKHHSLSDWDWSPVNTPVLDTVQKYSSPTSLCGRYLSGVWRMGYCFLKTPNNIPYGRLVTRYRTHFSGDLTTRWYYRVQVPPATYDGYPADGYWYKETTAFCEIWRSQNGGQVRLKHENHPNPYTVDTWVWERLTWYPYIDDPLSPKLAILFERNIGGVWTQQHLFVDEANLFASSSVNRVGYYLRPYTSNPLYNNWIDDTEVWKMKE